jgi:photosystem II stability/assembly factor-like uncharacterized protein
MSRDDRWQELDAILTTPTERLGPPDGSWERVARRGRRRKAGKATLCVAAGVAVIAGAVPAVIAVRHSSDNQTMAITASPPSVNPTAGTPQPSSAPVAATSLPGFVPQSLSFVSQDEGYLWGSAGTAARGVVAKTTDGGTSWTRLPSPRVNDSLAGRHGAGQIRFATGDVGFVYGARNFITTDGGQHWSAFPTAGYVADLEAMQGRIWALIRNCEHCRSVRLYSATAADPALRRVRQVPVMRSHGGAPEVAGAASIAVSGTRVDVIAGSAGFWTSPDGRHWKQQHDPCPSRLAGTPVKSALVTTTDTLGVAVACGYHVSGSDETKRLYTSRNSGASWQAVRSQPAALGYLQTLSAGSTSDIIVGTSRGGAQLSHDGGASWAASPPGGVQLSFVGFIWLSHIVAVADPLSRVGSFATSTDAGRHWSFTNFR